MKKENNVKYIFPRRGEIFEADLGIGEGSVQAGIRPVLVIQNDVGNHYSPTIICVPLTSKSKKEIPTHYTLTKEEHEFLAHDSVVLCEQVKTIPKQKLHRKIGTLSKEDMEQVSRRLMISMAL